ncbi:hypothetical protein V2J09_012724 [Rumex salicifolius]
MSTTEAKKEETAMKMKLLIDKTKGKVLFAEAGKDSVDFIFHMLSLPLGTIVGYLTKESMAGSIGNIYGSLESLGTDCIQDCFNKNCLLNPKPAPGSATNIPLLTVKPDESGSRHKIAYKCKNGWVLGLSVRAQTDIPAGSLEEREVTLNMKMGLATLKASLMSKTVLTDVFLPDTLFYFAAPK